jgi:hypothetical protein
MCKLPCGYRVDKYTSPVLQSSLYSYTIVVIMELGVAADIYKLSNMVVQPMPPPIHRVANPVLS